MLVDSLEGGNLRDAVLKGAFDARLEGDVGGRAPDAGAVEADANDTGVGDIDELDVTAVGLHGGADEVDDLANSVEECGRGFHVGVHHRGVSGIFQINDSGGGPASKERAIGADS